MQAHECQTLAQARTEIDRLNSEILVLLAQRQHYVERVAALKTDISEVPAPERRAAVLCQVAQEASDLGMSSEVAYLGIDIEALALRLRDDGLQQFEDAFAKILDITA